MVVDTSAWVEYLRATGSPADAALTDAVRASDDIGVPDVVRLELLAGAGTDVQVRDLQRLLGRFQAMPAASPADHETAAALYRAVRRTGATVRSLLDCLVAAAALRTDSPLLARDRDFEVIARVSPLRLV
jgi:predicted nucleic acid-binding protein